MALPPVLCLDIQKPGDFPRFRFLWQAFYIKTVSVFGVRLTCLHEQMQGQCYGNVRVTRIYYSGIYLFA